MVNSWVGKAQHRHARETVTIVAQRGPVRIYNDKGTHARRNNCNGLASKQAALWPLCNGRTVVVAISGELKFATGEMCMVSYYSVVFNT